jgi:TadE-like protein
VPGLSTAAIQSHARPATSRALKQLLGWVRKSEQGQAVVELALILPVVLLLLLGIVDYSQALNTDNTANHLANLGARFAAVGTIPSGKSLCEYIDSKEGPAPSSLQQQLGVVVKEPMVAVGQPVEVVVTHNYHWLKFIEGVVTHVASTSIVGSATMRVENTANGSMACSIPAPS